MDKFHCQPKTTNINTIWLRIETLGHNNLVRQYNHLPRVTKNSYVKHLFSSLKLIFIFQLPHSFVFGAGIVDNSEIGGITGFKICKEHPCSVSFLNSFYDLDFFEDSLRELILTLRSKENKVKDYARPKY